MYHLCPSSGEHLPRHRRIFAALLPVRERVSGAEHPDTLTSRANLAAWTGHTGDAAGARDQYATLLPVRKRSWAPPRAPWS